MAFEKDKPMDAPFEHVGLTKPHGGPYDVAVPELLRGACDDYVRNLGRLVVAVSRRLSAAGDAIEPQRLPTRFEFIRRLYTATGDVLDTSMADMLRQALLRALQDGLKRVAGRIAAQLPKPVSVVDILFTAEMRASGLMAKVELLGVDGMRLMVRARAELMRSNVKKTVYAKLIELKQDMSMLSWFEIQRRINSFEDELVAQLDGSFVQYSGTNERLRTYVEHFAASGLRELEQQVPLYAKAEFRAAAPQQRPSNKQAMTGDAKPTTTTTTTTTTTNAKAQQQAGTSSGEATATGNEGITGAGAPARNDAAPIAEPFREPSRKNVAQLSEVTRGGTNIVGGRKHAKYGSTTATRWSATVGTGSTQARHVRRRCVRRRHDLTRTMHVATLRRSRSTMRSRHKQRPSTRRVVSRRKTMRRCKRRKQSFRVNKRSSTNRFRMASKRY